MAHSNLAQCDFCNSHEVIWWFPCRDFTHKTDLSSVTAVMHEEWAACSKCAPLVFEGRNAELAMRGLDTTLEYRVLRNDLTLKERHDLFQMVFDMQDKFRSNRLCGPPLKVG